MAAMQGKLPSEAMTEVFAPSKAAQPPKRRDTSEAEEAPVTTTAMVPFDNTQNEIDDGEGEEEEYVVERILAERTHRSRKQ